MEYLTVGFMPTGDDQDMLLDLGDLPENSFRGVASVFGGIVDAYVPTIIHRGAFAKTLSEAGRGIKILWQHDVDEPIGVPTKLFESDEGLVLQANISRTQRGRDALVLLRDGVVDGLSIGFDPIKEDIEKNEDGSMVRHVREVRLWEVSVVTWGADPNARISEVNSHPNAKAFSKDQLNIGKLEIQTVQRFLDLPLLDRDREWDSGDAEDRVRTWAKAEEGPNRKYQQAFVYWDGQGQSFGDYKLPLVDIVDGAPQVVPRAVFAAAAAVQGARGGVDIPEDEMDAVKRHLGSYYRRMRKKFDDESIIPPWQLGEGAEPVAQSYSHYQPVERQYLVGQALMEGFITPNVASAALSLDKDAESSETLTPIPVDDLERQLLDAELAMSEAFVAAYPSEQ